jgi:hypothetical protein
MIIAYDNNHEELSELLNSNDVTDLDIWILD